MATLSDLKDDFEIAGEGAYVALTSAGTKIKSDTFYFSLLPDDFREEELDKLPERQRERIKSSPTYAETKEILSRKGKSTAEWINDDLPESLGGSPEDAYNSIIAAG